MFKQRAHIIKMRLIAGAGSTHPLLFASINKGWPPPKIKGHEITTDPFIDEAKDIDSDKVCVACQNPDCDFDCDGPYE